MPELPEVETVVRQLRRTVSGRRIRQIEIFDSKLLREIPTIRGRRAIPTLRGVILAVDRIGKEIVLTIRGARGAQFQLAVHLRMTGRLIWQASARSAREESLDIFYRNVGASSHVRAVLHLSGGSVVFIDPRRFGTFRYGDPVEPLTVKGIDPFDSRFTPDELRRLLQGVRQPIKPWLLRQDKVSGIGNIYASEILFLAKLRPTRPAAGITERESKRLYKAILAVLTKAIRHSGTTFSDYRDSTGNEGSYQNRLAVYDREGSMCRRCRTAIRKVVQVQRSTFFCPNCQ